MVTDPRGEGTGKLGQEIFCSPLKYHPYTDRATGRTMKAPPHQSLLLRHWRASVSPSSGLEKGLNSLRARRSISSSSSSHSGEPKVSTAGNELAVFKGDNKHHPAGQRGHTHEHAHTYTHTEPFLHTWSLILSAATHTGRKAWRLQS